MCYPNDTRISECTLKFINKKVKNLGILNKYKGGTENEKEEKRRPYTDWSKA